MVEWQLKNEQSSFYKKNIKPIVDRNVETLQRRIGGEFNMNNMVNLMHTYYFNLSMGYPTHTVLDNSALRKDLGTIS